MNTKKGDDIFIVHRKKGAEAHEIVYGCDDEYALIGAIELGKKTLMAPYNNYETNGLE
jgi:hypothetical protein